MTRPATDRAAGLLLLALAALYLALATTFRVAFMADPLGPRAAPLLLGAALAATAAVLIARPGADADWPGASARTRIAATAISFLAYALLLEPLGFVLATTLQIAGLALLLGGRPLPALAAGGAFATACYYLFVFALDVPLPIGRLFPFLGG